MTSDSNTRSKMDSHRPTENSNEHDSFENAVQQALDQTLNSQELNLIDNVLADKTRTYEEKNNDPTTNYALIDALAALNLGNEATSTSNHVSSTRILESVVIEKNTSTFEKKRNDTIEPRLPGDIPSSSNSQPQSADDLCTIFDQTMTIATPNEKPSAETNIQEPSITPNDKTWITLNEIGVYKVFTYGIKFKGVMHPYVAIVAQKENTDSKIVYHLKGSGGSNFRRYFSNEDLLEKEGYQVTVCKPLKIIRLASGHPFAEFKITHDVETYEGKTCPKLKNVVFYADSGKYYEEIFGKSEENSSKDPVRNQKKDMVDAKSKPGPSPAHSSKHSEKIANKKNSSKIPDRNQKKDQTDTRSKPRPSLATNHSEKITNKKNSSNLVADRNPKTDQADTKSEPRPSLATNHSEKITNKKNSSNLVADRNPKTDQADTKSEPRPSLTTNHSEKITNKKKSSNLVADRNPKTDQADTKSEPEPPVAYSSKHAEKITHKTPISKKKGIKTAAAESQTTVLSAQEISNFSNEKTWKTFTFGSYEIFAYTVKLKSNIPQVAVLVQQEKIDGRRVYHFKGSYEGQFKAYFDKPELLDKDEYIVSTHNRLKIIQRRNGEAFAKFTVNGLETFEGKRNCPRFEDFEFYTSSWYNYERIFGMNKEALSNLFLWDNWFERNFNFESEYTVYAFTVDSVKHTAVGVLASEKNSDSKQVYIFKGRHKKDFKKRFDDWHNYPKKDYGIITCNNSRVMYLTSEEPLAELKTAGISTYLGYSFPEVVYLHFFKDYYRSTSDQESEEVKSKDLIFGESLEKLSKLFNSDNWQNLDKNGNYEVYAVTVIEIDGHPYVGVLAKKENTDSKGVFQIEGNPKDGFRLLFEARTKGLRDCKVFKLNNSDVMCSAKELPIAKFKTDGMCYEKGRRFPKVDDLNFMEWN